MCFRERRDFRHAVSFLSAHLAGIPAAAYASFVVQIKGIWHECWAWLSRCFLGSADAGQKSAVAPAQTSISHDNA